MSNILTVESCYNPFFIDGREIKRIIFYNDSGIVLKTRSGWFGYNNNFRGGLDIPETISKRKVDLSIKKCFYVPVAPEYYERNKKCAELYLYIDGESIKLIDKTESQECFNKVDIWHYENFTFEICGHVIVENLVVKIERNEFGQKVDAIQKELEEAGIKIDSFDLKRLLEKYNLIKK